jgi:glycosyltransferase involved in cell wall biosynthesis
VLSIHHLKVKPDQVIIVVGPDDFETDETIKAWKSKLPFLMVLESSKPSMIYSLNIGLSAANGDIIALMDDDVELPKDWSIKIKSAYSTDNELGAFGGRDHLQLQEKKYSNPGLASVVGRFKWDGTLTGNHHCGSKVSPVQVDVLKGCNLSFRRNAFRKMEIDPILIDKGAETCSEIDICQSIAREGFKVIYDNENFLLHYASPRTPFDNRKDLFSSAWNKRVFNQAYVTAKYRPVLELIFYFFKSFLIGSRLLPGLAWSVLLIPKNGTKVIALPWKYLMAMAKGVSKGLSVKEKSERFETSAQLIKVKL